MSDEMERVRFTFEDFLNFKLMLTPDLISIGYILGVIGITVYGVAYLPESIGYKIGFILLANVLWRVLNEFYILFFSIHDQLALIEKQMG